jgi:hypothetical protein
MLHPILALRAPSMTIKLNDTVSFHTAPQLGRQGNLYGTVSFLYFGDSMR